MASADDATEAGGGPRHLALNPNGHYYYVNLEFARLARLPRGYGYLHFVGFRFWT